MGSILKDAASGWTEHRAQRLGAALSFYTTLALAPLSMIAIAVAGYFYGDDAARGRIVHHIEHVVGREGALVIEALVEKASQPHQSRIASLASVALLLFSAAGVFVELKDSLDCIWEVKQKPGRRIWMMIRTQLLAFSVVMCTGLLLLASLLMTAVLTAVTLWLDQWLPMPVGIAYSLDMVVSFVVVSILFALIFKLLPDVSVSWNAVWVGAVFTAIMFMLGKFLIGIYIGGASIGSIYGAAGSLVAIQVWTYYSAQILFFGAELIRAYR